MERSARDMQHHALTRRCRAHSTAPRLTSWDAFQRDFAALPPTRVQVELLDVRFRRQLHWHPSHAAATDPAAARARARGARARAALGEQREPRAATSQPRMQEINRIRISNQNQNQS
eukprot:COSAG02_NODE_2260_length_9317_cov_10.918365_5_plen_117_part_00